MTNQAGGGWIDPADNAVQIDSPESVRAYAVAASWVTEYEVASLDGALDEDVAAQSFVSGPTAIEMNSTGGLTEKPAEVDFELGVAPLPCDAVCTAPIGGATLGIVAAADDAVKDGAWDFIEFATTPESNAFVFARTGYLPIIDGAMDVSTAAERIAEHPEYLVADRQLDVAFARARPPAMPAIREAEPAVWQSIALGDETVEAALGSFADRMRAMPARN